MKLCLRLLSVLPFLLPLGAGSACAQQKQQSELRVFDPSLIDASVQPCENFYRYSCNGWFKKNPLPADQTSYGRFHELFEQNRVKLRGILEAAAVAAPGRTPNEQKIGDAYASCMDESAIDRLGMKAYEPELARIAGLTDRARLPELVGELQQHGVNAFFGVGSMQDFEDSSRVILAAGAGGLGLPERDYYTRTDAKTVEQRQHYAAYIAEVLGLTGEPAAAAGQDADAILALETRMARVSLTVTELRDPQNINHPMALPAFAATMTHFDMGAFDREIGLPAVSRVNVMEPRFYAELNAIVADTDMAVIRAYLRFHYLTAMSGTSAPGPLDRATFAFYSQYLRGQQKQQDRWKRCTGMVDNSLGEALGQVYVARYFPPADKDRTLEMTQAIEQAMDKDIDSLDWMSARTKLLAKAKLKAVTNKVGYPDKWRDYSKLEIVRGDALGNHVRATRFEFARDLNKIGKPVDKGEWSMTPPTVNAYYDPQMNNVNFPAGYLQPPFFSAREDDAANYGDMGSTVGHELTHGFDDQGRQFDAEGNLKDWWTAEDAKRFSDRTECMVKQFDAIEPLPGVHINGRLTLGENIADLGGLWLAYMAWQQREQGAEADPAARVSGYTAEQRFWIAYAQQWCTEERTEALRTRLQTDPHSPDEYRANTILSDLPEFARSFGCSRGQPMVAATQCKVW